MKPASDRVLLTDKMHETVVELVEQKITYIIMHTEITPSPMPVVL